MRSLPRGTNGLPSRITASTLTFTSGIVSARRASGMPAIGQAGGTQWMPRSFTRPSTRVTMSKAPGVRSRRTMPRATSTSGEMITSMASCSAP